MGKLLICDNNQHMDITISKYCEHNVWKSFGQKRDINSFPIEYVFYILFT